MKISHVVPFVKLSGWTGAPAAGGDAWPEPEGRCRKNPERGRGGGCSSHCLKQVLLTFYKAPWMVESLLPPLPIKSRTNQLFIYWKYCTFNIKKLVNDNLIPSFRSKPGSRSASTERRRAPPGGSKGGLTRQQSRERFSRDKPDVVSVYSTFRSIVLETTTRRFSGSLKLNLRP